MTIGREDLFSMFIILCITLTIVLGCITCGKNSKRDQWLTAIQSLKEPMPLVAMKTDKRFSIDGSMTFFLLIGGGNIHGGESRVIRMAYKYGGFVRLLEVPEGKVRFRIDDNVDSPYMEIAINKNSFYGGTGQDLIENPTQFIVTETTSITITAPAKYLPSGFELEL